MRLMINQTEADETVTGIVFSYSGRQNGWYCYACNAAGDQIGAAEYRYHRMDVLEAANWLRKEYNLPVGTIKRL